VSTRAPSTRPSGRHRLEPYAFPRGTSPDRLVVTARNDVPPRLATPRRCSLSRPSRCLHSPQHHAPHCALPAPCSQHPLSLSVAGTLRVCAPCFGRLGPRRLTGLEGSMVARGARFAHADDLKHAVAQHVLANGALQQPAGARRVAALRPRHARRRLVLRAPLPPPPSPRSLLGREGVSVQ